MARILSIDEGTTSVRGFIFDERGRLLGTGQREFTQHYPKPGLVEHDTDEIWQATLTACREAMDDAGTSADHITCVGITNQRETVAVWDKSTHEPIHKAIVWQDRRTAERCDEIRDAGHEDRIREVTGLVIDAYFSGTKLQWLLDNVEGARERAENGELAFGTMDSWLVMKLSGATAHVTEPSNACRTLLWDLRGGEWSQEMCDIIGVPMNMLPEVKDSAGEFARTSPEVFLGIDAPITGIGGDQQAAMFGQGAWEAGMSKNTYGTGSFLTFNTGSNAPESTNGLLTSAAWRIDGETTYMLEGSIFVTGASVQWLRDELGIIDDAAETEQLAAKVEDGNEGVYLVPAFTGLGAPHWDGYARATMVGMTRGTGRGHFARAAIEAMAYQSADVLDLMLQESNTSFDELRVDGGASNNDLMCQFQADILGVPVVRPQMAETTVMGAAFLAGLGAGVWSSTEELKDIWQLDKRFEPQMDEDKREKLKAGWQEAVERAKGWAKVVGNDE